MYVEQWKTLEDWENYEVSSLGRVRNKKTGTIRKPTYTKKGYERLTFSRKGKSFSVLIHQLVAKAFIENTFNKETVNHKDGNKQNNRVENLEWMTFSENSIHGHQNNFCNNSIATRCGKKVIAYKNGNYIGEYKSQRDAAKALNINFNTVWKCLANYRGKTRVYDYTFEYAESKVAK